jgi:hypothetical protein
VEILNHQQGRPNPRPDWWRAREASHEESVPHGGAEFGDDDTWQVRTTGRKSIQSRIETAGERSQATPMLLTSVPQLGSAGLVQLHFILIFCVSWFFFRNKFVTQGYFIFKKIL